MRNRASCYPIQSRVAAITLAWLRALSLGLLGVMLGSTPAEAKPFAYVTNFTSNTVSVIDTATNTVVATVPVGNSPREVAITPDGTHAYVANSFLFFPDTGTVSVIVHATHAVVATVPVGGVTLGVATAADGTHAYVTTQGPGTVSVIATATNTVVATVPVGSGPFGVAITPDGTRAYVTTVFPSNVSVIDTA